MTRMFWFGLGMAAGLGLSRKLTGAARRVTPAGAAENVGDAVRELAEALGSFGADVRAGMAERETELHAAVEQRTGIDTAPRHLATGSAAWTPPQRRPEQSGRGRRGGRAPRAGEAAH